MKEVLLILKKTGLLKGWIINNSNNAQSSIAGDLVRAEFYFGDHSPGHSEKYCLRLTPMNDIDPRGTISMVNLNYGVCETKTNLLYRGEEYTLTLEHAGTTESGSPDYDYTLEVSVPQPSVIDDPDTIICENEDSTSFFAAGKQAYIRIGGLDLDIDFDGDGIVNNIDSEEQTEADPGVFTAVSNRVAIALRSTDFVTWTGTAELVVPTGIDVYSAQTGETPLSSLTFASLPQTLYVMSVEPGEYTLKLVPQGLNSGDAVKLTVVKVDLDIRETVQVENRVCRDDPRVNSNARNRILVWANSGANTVTFDLLKPPDIVSPVWVQIEDQNGLNSRMPHFKRLDTTSETYTYTVADENDNADLVIKYGADYNGDGTLNGDNEIVGTYEIYGVTAEEYSESRSNYTFYFLLLHDMADQLHKKFRNGVFDVPVWPQGDYRPTSVSGFATLSADRFTHNFGSNFSGTGSVNLNGRMYYSADATVPIYYYASNSVCAVDIRASDPVKNGLNSFIAGLDYTSISNAYANASGGNTRSITFSLAGCGFNFGAVGEFGLGGVSIGTSAPYVSSGIIITEITKTGSNYNVASGSIINLVLYDLFDFNYFNNSWAADYSDASRSAAMIQSGFGKTGSTLNSGQIGLVKIEVSGNTATDERIVTP